jgi:hypothetical protein
MRCNARAAAVAGWVLLVLALPAASSAPLVVRINPGPATGAPAKVTVLALIETHADNRALEVVAESPDFLRRSRMSLDGERAPRVNQVVFANLPVGRYEVTVVLFGSRGPRASHSRWLQVAPSIGR